MKLDITESSILLRFKSRAQCIISQYGNYTVEGPKGEIPVNGINTQVFKISPNQVNLTTQGENIADHGGIKLAYSAYGMFCSLQAYYHPNNYKDSFLELDLCIVR